MSLRWKINLTVGLTLLAAVGVVLLVSQTVFMRGFESVERSEVQEQVKRAQTAVKWNLDELGAAVKSYASWDDAVAFLEDRNQRFIDSNFPESFFTGFRANVAAILDGSGTLAWGGGYDLESSEPVDLPLGLVGYLTSGSLLASHPGVTSDVSGILMLPQGPLLVDSQPILTSNGEGPVRGAFVLGRWLDETTLAHLGTQTRLDLVVTEASAGTLPLQVRDAVAAPDAGADIVVVPQGPDAIAGYAVLRDIFGEPAAVLEVDVPRVVYAEGARSVLYFMFALIGVVVVFGTGANRLLERSLFRRLAQLTAQVRRVDPGKGELAPIAVGGNDELTVLARTINSSLSQLENTRTQQEKQARSLSQTLDELQGRHRDLEKAHRHLQHLQEASVSLGGSLEIADALAQLVQVALDIFDADEVWLLRFDADQRQLQGLRAFVRQKPGYATLPRVFGCEQADGILDQEAIRLLRAVFSGSSAVFIESIADLPPDEHERLFGQSLPDLGRVPLVGAGAALCRRGPRGSYHLRLCADQYVHRRQEIDDPALREPGRSSAQEHAPLRRDQGPGRDRLPERPLQQT